jgi:hypothetical protein
VHAGHSQRRPGKEPSLLGGRPRADHGSRHASRRPPRRLHGSQRAAVFLAESTIGLPIAPPGSEGIRLYWAPGDLEALRERLLRLGYSASAIEDRDYGQTEFFVTDDDGYSHCFGVATRKSG